MRLLLVTFPSLPSSDLFTFQVKDLQGVIVLKCASRAHGDQDSALSFHVLVEERVYYAGKSDPGDTFSHILKCEQSMPWENVDEHLGLQRKLSVEW